MRVWRSELYADKALTMPCVTIYVKAADFVDAMDLINFSALNFAVVSYPMLPVEVEGWAMAFPPGERIRFVPLTKPAYP